MCVCVCVTENEEKAHVQHYFFRYIIMKTREKENTKNIFNSAFLNT